MMKNVRFTKTFSFISVFAILASPHLMLPGFEFRSSVLWQYFPLLVANTVRVLYLNEIFSRAHHS